MYYSKPKYEYNYEYGLYVGSTIYISNGWGFLVTLFGIIIALSRMRDRVIRSKIKNLWY